VVFVPEEYWTKLCTKLTNRDSSEDSKYSQFSFLLYEQTVHNIPSSTVVILSFHLTECSVLPSAMIS